MEGYPPAPEPTMQESVGGSHSPPHSIRRSPPVREAPVAPAPRERRHDKLQKMGAEDFKRTTNPLEAKRWLQQTDEFSR